MIIHFEKYQLINDRIAQCIFSKNEWEKLGGVLPLFTSSIIFLLFSNNECL